MNDFQKIKEILEFDKILDFIAGKCVSETGRARLKNSRPLTDETVLRRVLQWVAEMRQVYLAEGGLPLWDFVDVRILLNKIEPENSFLETQDFSRLQNFLEIVAELRAFGKKHQEKFPELQHFFRRLEAVQKLSNQIRFTIDHAGNIYDNASPQLKAIRGEMARIDQEIHQKLERIKRKNAEHIQEDFITLSDGRLVLPVREYSVSKIPGIVHGQSGSGATYYVEPMVVVELNNQMQKLRADERKEIIRLLRQLSDLVREEQSALLNNLEILTDLDVLQAKARYANEFDCSAPDVDPEFEWHLTKARHPLLLKMHKDTTVPLTMEAGKDFRILVISGPNAGGKTVALKTVGMLQLMFQSGFHIPVAEGTRMPLCEKVFAAIGDEQSIENDLSTFSSHIQSIKEILDHVSERSLVLIDEIGSGTEPSGGAALAIAVLEQLNRPGIVTLATTHQNQLKVFAAENDGLENAAMQFDMDELRPLFTMEIGVPGSSYTFEICRRLGLQEEVVQRAVSLVGEEVFKLESVLNEVTRKSQYYRRKADEVSILESKLKSLEKLYEQKVKELERKRKKYDQEARREAREFVRDVNRKVEAAIREIRESQADRQVVKKARQQLNELKDSLRSEESATTAAENAPDIRQLQTGQRVRSVSYGIIGTVSKVFTNRQEVELEREGLKITVPVADVELLDPNGQVVRPKTAGKISSAPVGGNVANELDLRGLTVDEAISRAAAYLDQALLSEWSEVRLIHGKGTGALRQALHAYLRKRGDIKEFRLGKWGEGDTGVTVVPLKPKSEHPENQ